MKKIVIATGHTCFSINPEFPEGIVQFVEELQQPGKLIHMKGVSVNAGGSVVNTGIAMKIPGVGG